MNTEQSDLIVQKTATVALTYYPEITVDSPDFDLWSEVDYCLEHVAAGDVDEDTTKMLRSVIARTIIDPTKHREDLTDLLYELTQTADDAGRAPSPEL